jgi:hypothetical protein
MVEEWSCPVSNTGEVEDAGKFEEEKIWNLKETKESNQGAVLVRGIHHRSETNECFEILCQILVESICDEPLGCSLGVAEPYHLTEVPHGIVEDIVNVSGDVILSHFVHGEVPELRIISGVVEVSV